MTKPLLRKENDFGVNITKNLSNVAVLCTFSVQNNKAEKVLKQTRYTNDQKSSLNVEKSMCIVSIASSLLGKHSIERVALLELQLIQFV